MRKFIGIAIILTLLLTVVGCGSSESPEEAVKKGFKAIVELDQEKMQKYFGEDVIDGMLLDDEDFVTEDEENIKLFVKNLEYKVLETKVDGDNAVVKAKITNIDMKEVIGEYFIKAMGVAFSGKDEDAMEKEMEEILIELLQDEDINLTTSEVNINLHKGEDNWIIDLDEDVINAIFGGLLSIADDF